MTELIAFECIEPSNIGDWLLARLVATVHNALKDKAAPALSPAQLMGEKPAKQSNEQQQAMMGLALGVSRANANNRKS